jgi:hypothetical protein
MTESKFHIIDKLKFLPSTLLIQLTSLHTGQPNGLIGLPLTITDESSRYLVKFDHVGRFRVINEAFNQFTEPYERISYFLYRMINSQYLQEYGETAKIFAHDVPHDAIIEHYVVYSEFYVVDVLSARPPTIELLSESTFSNAPH